MDRHRDACPDQVDGFTQEAQWLIRELMKELEDQFKLDVQVGKSADLSVVSVKGEEWRSKEEEAEPGPLLPHPASDGVASPACRDWKMKVVLAQISIPVVNLTEFSMFSSRI